jgi:hypothetical protein
MMSRRDAKHGSAISPTRSELPVVSETLKFQTDEPNEVDIAALVSFFKLIDKWDREVERNAKAV